ncbi:hypothetical protein M3Y96_00608600 [Aphelenchoides besseyi]|nr:hypothetical protein M3Y96_00608600 [Aphelenchoides besseyi]
MCFKHKTPHASTKQRPATTSTNTGSNANAPSDPFKGVSHFNPTQIKSKKSQKTATDGVELEPSKTPSAKPSKQETNNERESPKNLGKQSVGQTPQTGRENKNEQTSQKPNETSQMGGEEEILECGNPPVKNANESAEDTLKGVGQQMPTFTS